MLIAAAADEETAGAATFGVTEKRDWVANSLAGLAPVRAGRFLVHGAPRPRQSRRERRRAWRSRRVSPSAPATTARPAAASSISTGSSSAAGRGPCSTSAAGPACSRSRRPRSSRRKVWLGDIDSIAVEVANANARLNGVGQDCRAVVSRGVENRALREGAPYDVVFANILAKPLRLLAPSLAAVTAPGGEAIVSGLLLADVAGVLASWRAQGFHLAERIDLEGWSSLRLRPPDDGVAYRSSSSPT